MVAKPQIDIGEYQYGFRDEEDYVFKSERGLNRKIVEDISAMKDEPEWMRDFRLKALDHFEKRPMPNWGADLSGIDAVLERQGVRERLEQVDAVITGEGKLDAQTVDGKVIDGVTRWAAKAGRPVYAVVGRNDASTEVLATLGISEVLEAGDPVALRRAGAQLTRRLGS